MPSFLELGSGYGTINCPNGANASGVIAVGVIAEDVASESGTEGRRLDSRSTVSDRPLPFTRLSFWWSSTSEDPPDRAV